LIIVLLRERISSSGLAERMSSRTGRIAATLAATASPSPVTVPTSWTLLPSAEKSGAAAGTEKGSTTLAMAGWPVGSVTARRRSVMARTAVRNAGSVVFIVDDRMTR
jgi:hypothetical protein